jgi:hypothetical protein
MEKKKKERSLFFINYDNSTPVLHRYSHAHTYVPEEFLQVFNTSDEKKGNRKHTNNKQ